MLDLSHNKQHLPLSGADATTASPAPPSRQPMVLHARVITGAGGGPDKTILNSPRFLADLGYQCVCAFLRPPADSGFAVIRQRATAWNAPLAEIDDRGALDWRILPAALQLCRQHQVDIWHAHDYKTNLLGLFLRRKHPMRLVTTMHGWVEHTLRTRLYYLVDRWSLPRYERVICVSDDILQCCRKYGVTDNRSVLIENAIDTDQFRRLKSVAAAKEAMDWPATRFLVGAVGRLSSEKAFDVLIRAIHELVQSGVDLGLLIAGDGGERAPLQALIDKLGLSERVRLVGFQGDLRPLYEAMDLFVLSSLREGLPNVLLEAMALEVPVVATRIAGIPRLIADGENGLLLPAGDQAALARAIRHALESSELRLRWAAAGRKTIEDRYSFAARMKKVAAVYDQLLAVRCGSGTQP
jgi:glycosyltransferase involved in cell wall biosynthesis